MTRLAALAIAVALGLCLFCGVVHATETGPPAETCAGYAASLQRARQCLAKEDRAGALAALRDARAALAQCLRQGAGETALAAR